MFCLHFTVLLLVGSVAAQSQRRCKSSQTTSLAKSYPPGTMLTVQCSSPFIGVTVTTCTVKGRWTSFPFGGCFYQEVKNNETNQVVEQFESYEDSDEFGNNLDDNAYTWEDELAGEPVRSRWCQWPKVAPSYPTGANITVECPYGYRNIRPGAFYSQANVTSVGRVVCRRNGTWSRDTLGECHSFARNNACSLPRTPRNGRIYYRSPALAGGPDNFLQFARGSFIRYECLDGYVLYGPARINCLNDGRWSTDPPRCAK